MENKFEEFVIQMSDTFDRHGSDVIRNNVACRSIRDFLGANCVTILIFEGSKNYLVSRGFSIDPEKGGLRFADQDFGVVLQHVDQFEDWSAHDSSQDGIKERLPLGIGVDHGHVVALVQKYRRYVANISSEMYAIGSGMISSDYFSELLRLGDRLRQEPKLVDLTQVPDDGNGIRKNLANLGIDYEEHGVYVAMPLFASRRYFGILRIIFDHQTMGEVASKESVGYSIPILLKERLCFIAQLLSLHLESNYLLDGYQNLSRIIDKREVDRHQFDRECDAFANYVNCWGAIVRLYDEEAKESVIRGCSQNLRGYPKKVEDWVAKNPTNQVGLNSAIRKVFEEDDTCVALTFSLHGHPAERVPCQKVCEVKHEGGGTGVLVEKRIEIELSEFASHEYMGILEELKLGQLMILPIPVLKESFVAFCNTKHRSFVNADVEMIVPAIRNFGFEVKRSKDHEIEDQLKSNLARADANRSIFHQFAAPLASISMQFEDYSNKKQEERDRVVQNVMKLARQANRKVGRYQKMLAVSDGKHPFGTKLDTVTNLSGFIHRIVQDYQIMVEGKAIQIGLFALPGHLNEPFYINTEMLSEVLHTLLDNAAKYCYSQRKANLYVPGFDPKDVRTPGHIHVEFLSNKEGQVIRITNWGAKIEQFEREKVFQKDYRGKHANTISPEGSGLGLFLVRSFLEQFGHHVVAESSGDRVTMVVRINHQIS